MFPLSLIVCVASVSTTVGVSSLLFAASFSLSVVHVELCGPLASLLCALFMLVGLVDSASLRFPNRALFMCTFAAFLLFEERVWQYPIVLDSPVSEPRSSEPNACPQNRVESMALCSRFSFMPSCSSFAPTWTFKSPPTRCVCVRSSSCICRCVFGDQSFQVVHVRLHIPACGK